ncbi:MAG: kinase [Gammaproteobacteria bacterium]|nr:MAG: kinase [Gammaproteobacteria bacterium]
MRELAMKPVADRAVLVSFADELDDAAHQRIIALDRLLAEDPPEGMLEAVPALVNILLIFDPEVTDHDTLSAAVEQRLAGLESAVIDGREHVVQVCYDEAFAPDLAAVAEATGLSVEAVIEAHLAADFQVLMYGFVPGYAYLGGVPKAIQVPRKPAPVRGVAAGSVIIAGPQCLVTTLIMPTGWSIIGRSPTKILTGDDTRPFLFDVADRVRFERIGLAEYERVSEAGATKVEGT